MKAKRALERARREDLALTFDDVRLQTNYSEVMPDDVNLETRFSRNVGLKIPIVSAAMDTVTEYELAIELAKLGGIGVIHRGLSIKDQASQVARVKHHLNALIERPIFVYDDETISAILQRKEQKKYKFHSFPVVSRKDSGLVGIITGNDFEFCIHNSQLAKEIMTAKPLTAPEGTTLDAAYDIMIGEKKKSLPLVNEKGELCGMYVLTDVKRIKTRSAETYNVDRRNQLRVAAAVGIGEEALERAGELVRNNVDVIVIDTAHGDSIAVTETLKRIKEKYSVDVVVGNISVGNSALRLAEAGADGIKVGQGPGSICTTRRVAGIGRPQVSAVYDCAMAIQKKSYDIPICADGGITSSGDITVAIGAGAYCVMMGSALAGTDESPGKKVFADGRAWKSYRGMGSIGAMEDSKSSRERYLQTRTGKNQLISEGVEGLVPFKGSLSDVVFQYIGGLRRGMGYVGAGTIAELRDKGQFDRITNAGIVESHPHDVKITVEPPNYEVRD